MDFTGAWTAIITPFSEDGRTIDRERLAEQIAYQAEGGITGVVVCGTTGESPTLSADEQRWLIGKVVELGRAAGLKVVAGAGSNDTSHAVEMQQFAKDAGVDAALQVNPYYNKPSQEGLYRHFSTIADAADLPVMLYNIPGRTGVALQPETVARLAPHPGIQAIKEATGSLDSASEILMRCGGDIQLLSGDDSMTLPFASVGGVGVVSVVSNIMPGRTARLCEAFNSGDWPTARELHFQLFAVAKALLSLDTNPVPIKTAMKLLGRDSGALRLPMCEPPQQVVSAIETLLNEAGLDRREPVAV